MVFFGRNTYLFVHRSGSLIQKYSIVPDILYWYLWCYYPGTNKTIWQFYSRL